MEKPQYTNLMRSDCRFYDTFTIVNDANGDVDELIHPCNPNGSFSNA